MTLNAGFILKSTLRTARLTYVRCGFRIRPYAYKPEEGEWTGGSSPPPSMWAADALFLCGSWASSKIAYGPLTLIDQNVQSILGVVCALLHSAVTKYRWVGRCNLTFMCYKFLVLTVKNGKNRCTFREVIAKIKPVFWATLYNQSFRKALCMR